MHTRWRSNCTILFSSVDVPYLCCKWALMMLPHLAMKRLQPNYQVKRNSFTNELSCISVSNMSQFWLYIKNAIIQHMVCWKHFCSKSELLYQYCSTIWENNGSFWNHSKYLSIKPGYLLYTVTCVWCEAVVRGIELLVLVNINLTMDYFLPSTT